VASVHAQMPATKNRIKGKDTKGARNCLARYAHSIGFCNFCSQQEILATPLVEQGRFLKWNMAQKINRWENVALKHKV